MKISSIIIFVFFSLNVYCQVENEIGDEYKEANYDSIHIKKKVAVDPRSDPSKKVCDPTAKIDPANTIKIGNLEVMKKDLLLFGEYDEIWFTKAQELCKSLGEGWRLPNEEELKLMFHKKLALKDKEYWFDRNDGKNYSFKMFFDIGGKDDDGKDTWYMRSEHREVTKFIIRAGSWINEDSDAEGGQINVLLDAHVRAVRTIK